MDNILGPARIKEDLEISVLPSLPVWLPPQSFHKSPETFGRTEPDLSPSVRFDWVGLHVPLRGSYSGRGGRG